MVTIKPVLTADTTRLTADSTLVTLDMVWPALVTPPTSELDDYLALVTSQHASRPKFMASLTASLIPLVLAQQVIARLPEDFDLDEAVGSQLDVVGQWVGISRLVKVPIPNLFFSFGDARKGFGLGYWKGPFDSASGISRLDNDTYRVLLRAKIAANSWDGTTEAAQTILEPVFGGDGTLIFVEDNQNMSMTVGVSGTIPSLLLLALLGQGALPLKPEGVRTVYSVTTVDQAPVFGFGADNEYVGGFGHGAWGRDPSYFTD